MQLLYISTFMFHKEAGKTYGLPSCADSFFEKYLDVFDCIKVLGEKTKKYLETSALIEIKNPKISIEILPANTRPKDYINDRKIKKELEKEISKAEAVLIKPASRRGMMAIKIAEKMKKPYMIEMTGDIHNALMQSQSIVKRLYAPILYTKIKKAIRNCEFGLYVSREYLQSKYKIKGKMCGCADVIIEVGSNDVLKKRLNRINTMRVDKEIKLALVGFYQGKGKGVDTALRALARLPQNYKLYVLGNGTEESRKKWYEYSKRIGVSKERLCFPEPLPSAEEVTKWLDEQDFFVFPTRSEGLGRVVVEAISRGMPCFATNICTMPELLDAECLFELDDDKKLAELLLKYTNNKSISAEVARVNFERAKEYNFEDLRKKRNLFLAQFREYCIRENK